MTLFKRSLYLLLVMTLVSCVKADRKSTNNENVSSLEAFSRGENLIPYNNRSSFTVGDVTLEDIHFTRAGQSEWREVNQFQIFFKLCNIRDRASNGTIRNQKFHISSELGEDVVRTQDGKNKRRIGNPITVNTNDCLRWSQFVPSFDLLAPSVNIILHYEIRPVSGSVGSIIKRVGFNPWDMYRNKSQRSKIVDLTDYDESEWHLGEWVRGEKNIIAALKGEHQARGGQQVRLQLKNLKVEPSELDQSFFRKIKQREQELDEDINKRQKETAKLLGVDFKSLDKKFADLRATEKARHNKLRENHISKAGIKMVINMSASPFVQVFDSTGVQHTKDITSGRFRVFMNIMAEGADHSGKMYRLAHDTSDIGTANASNQVWKMKNNQIIAYVPMALKKLSTYGKVKLVVKVEAVDMKGVEPFAAVYDLGQHDQWVKRQNPQFDGKNYQALDQIKYEQFVQDAEPIDKDLSTVRDAEKFYFGPLRMRFVRIMPGETATDRTMQYSVTSCIEDGLTGRRLGPGVQFEIETEDMGVVHPMRRQTNEDGCLTWFGFLSHKYYRKEVLSEKVANIKYVGSIDSDERNEFESVINKYVKNVIYYMNPWDEKWTFGWDRPDMPKEYPDEIKEQRENAPASQLFVADFRYETMGFRYAIDKYLNLKVKKAVLLKAWPHVLKYNSIVRGRGGVEKLRDGIYLMKVALQKDYLDPAAKGVQIYDSKLEQEFLVNSEEKEENYVLASAEDAGDFLGAWSDSEDPLSTYDVLGHQSEVSPEIINGRASHPGIDQVISANDRSQDQPITTQRKLSDEELRQHRKQYISVQQKLVRVMNGMIITPVEFEVEDLRLMRIRNQFFIQLQTIDENKLRVATLMSESLKNRAKNFSLESAYQQVYDALGETGQIDEKSFQDLLTSLQKNRLEKAAYSELVSQNRSGDLAQKRVFDLFGLSEFPEGTAEYNKRFEDIKKMLTQMVIYKAANLDAQTALRNERKNIIDEILYDYREMTKEELSYHLERVEKKYKDKDVDPFYESMFFGGEKPSQELLFRLINEKIEEAQQSGDKDREEIIRSIGLDDFMTTPLTPAFSFDLLRNDGVPEFDKNGTEIGEQGLSGLPSRTFVGPLTFVFNTNGSSLRPTDALPGGRCRTEFCEVAEKKNSPITEMSFQSTMGMDGSGQIIDDFNKDLYIMGDSINSSYERDKYYGYQGEYANKSVDDLVTQKIDIEKRRIRNLEVGSQVINFVQESGLKYVALDENKKSYLKTIDYKNCVEETPLGESVEHCLESVIPGTANVKRDAGLDKLVLSKETLKKQLNERFFKNKSLNYDPRGSHGINHFKSPHSYYDLYEKNLEESDINFVIENSVSDLRKKFQQGHIEVSELKSGLDKIQGFQHRMCFVLAQNYFSNEYLKKEVILERKIRKNKNITTKTNKETLREIESWCQKLVGRLYGYLDYEEQAANLGTARSHIEENGLNIPHEDQFRFPPIVLERKARVFETTGRYVYRGGKSLNINLSSGFNLSSSRGIKTTSSTAWKPYEQFTGVAYSSAGLIAGIVTASKVGAVTGAALGPVGLAAGALVGGAVAGITKAIIGGFSFTRSTGHDEAAGRTQGLTVSGGTFLVSQQANLAVELGDYDRCMVARFHPNFSHLFTSVLASKGLLKEDYNPETDIESQGLMICSGVPKKQCLPVNEKYYYFTQHFTEGDMLDTADMHNHPWLLQLRGVRDFKTFTSAVGARQVDYIDTEAWLASTAGKTLSDAAHWKTTGTGGSQHENYKRRFQLANQADDIDWPLSELSRVYFKVLPTFPGLYTFYEDEPEWPYFDTDAGRSFEGCENP